MYQFEELVYLNFLWAIPVMLALAIWHKRWQQRTAKRFFDLEMLERMAPGKSGWRPATKVALQTLAILSIVIGLAGPKVGTRVETLNRQGADVVFLLDVSRSMLVEDVQPNRLEKAKLIVSRSIDQMAGDRLGIVAYAGIAVQQLPITNDYRAAKMALSAADPSLITTQGSDIGDAILMGIQSFDPETSKNKVMVLLSDGEDHEGGIATATEALKGAGVKLYALGFGTNSGGPVPDVTSAGRARGFFKGPDGEVAISARNESVLQDLATATGGQYLSGNRTNEAIEKLERIFSGLERTTYEAQLFTDFEHQFQWFIGLGLLLLFIDGFLLEKRSFILERWGIITNKTKA
jgi:Ca-activated chloride channel homolog